MQVLVSNFGSFVGKTGERLVIKEEGQVAAEVPFADLEQLTIATSGVTLSSDVIRECAERGIQIAFLTSSGRPYAKIVSPNLTATIITRREQLYAYGDDRAVALARAFVEEKIRSQIDILNPLPDRASRAPISIEERPFDTDKDDLEKEFDRLFDGSEILPACFKLVRTNHWPSVVEASYSSEYGLSFKKVT